jgi:hypothetical protein
MSSGSFFEEKPIEEIRMLPLRCDRGYRRSRSGLRRERR